MCSKQETEIATEVLLSPSLPKTPIGRPDARSLLLREAHKHRDTLFKFKFTKQNTKIKRPSTEMLDTEDGDETPTNTPKKKMRSGNGDENLADRGYVQSAMNQILQAIAELRTEHKESHSSLAQQFAELRKEVTEKDEKMTEFKQDVTKRLNDIEARLDEHRKPVTPALEERLDALKTEMLSHAQQNIIPDAFGRLNRHLKALERMDSEKRKMNIMIKGFTPPSRNVLSDVNNFIASHCNLDNSAVSAIIVSKPGTRTAILAEIVSWDQKVAILRAKKTNLPKGIIIEPDQTPEEQRRNVKLREEVRRARAQGKTAKIVGKRVLIDGAGFYWDETNGQLQRCTRQTPQPLNSNGTGRTDQQQPEQPTVNSKNSQ